jgi:hypothetical protein
MGRNGLYFSTTPSLFVLGPANALGGWLELRGNKEIAHQSKGFCILIHRPGNCRDGH